MRIPISGIGWVSFPGEGYSLRAPLRKGRPGESFARSKPVALHGFALSAAAAATEPATIAASASAHSARKGIAKLAAPGRLASAVATPKIRIGTMSGTTRIESSMPPRRRLAVSAAPIAPVKVSAMVPGSEAHRRAEKRHGLDAEHEAEERRRDRERQPARKPMRDALRRDDRLERHGAHAQELERAVLLVGLEQAVEPDQRREKRSDPQNGRADARQEVEIGADREGQDGDERKIEDEAEAEAAADPGGELEVARDEGKKRARHPPILISEAGMPIGSCVAATIRPPAARCSLMSPARRAREALSRAAVGSSSSHRGRRDTRRRASATRRRCPAER